MLDPQCISSAELAIRILRGNVLGFRCRGKLAYLITIPCFCTPTAIAYISQVEWTNWAVSSEEVFSSSTEAIAWAGKAMELWC